MRNAQRGFTLLELLLSLAVIAALMVTGLSVYQIQQRNFKVEKTALQMQQWLQATMAFYTDCGTWPDPAVQANITYAMTGGADITPQACPTLQKNTRIAYMPASADINGPWGNSYSVQPVTPAPGQKTSKMGEVITTIVGASPDPKYAHWLGVTGNLIAARLPFASATLGQNAKGMPQSVIVAAVNAPGTNGGDTTHGYLLGMQVVSRTKMSELKNPATQCPAGMRGIIGYAISKASGFKDGNTPAILKSFSSYNVSNGLLRANLDTYTTGSRNDPNTGDDNNNQTLLITACVPVAPASQAQGGQDNQAGRF